jgi:hypothetical protein
VADGSTVTLSCTYRVCRTTSSSAHCRPDRLGVHAASGSSSARGDGNRVETLRRPDAGRPRSTAHYLGGRHPRWRTRRSAPACLCPTLRRPGGGAGSSAFNGCLRPTGCDPIARELATPVR